MVSMARTRRAQTISLTPELGAKLDAAEKVLDVPKSRIHRRALTAYFDGLPTDQRIAIEARAALPKGNE
jgi:predicted transcriptional regulator